MTSPDRTQLETIYREHRGAIARQIRALLQDDSAVDDLVNETFLRAHRALGSFDGRSALTTWLHGIAINVARTHMHTSIRRAGIFARVPAAPPPVVDGPDDDLVARDALHRFRVAVRELSDPLREAFVLRVLEERGWQEIADQLGVAISTLHGRVARAEAIVRAKMESP